MSFPDSYPSSPIVTKTASSTGTRKCHDYALAASGSTSTSSTLPTNDSTWSSSSSPHHPTHWSSPNPVDSSLDDQWQSKMMMNASSATVKSSPTLGTNSPRTDREALLKGGWSRDRQPRFHHPQPAPQSEFMLSSSLCEHSLPRRSITIAFDDSAPSPEVGNTMRNPSHSSPHRARMDSNANWLDNDDFDDDLYSLFGAHYNPHHGGSTSSSDHTLRASKKSRQDANNDRDPPSPVSGFKSLGQKASKFSLRSIASAMSLPTSSSSPSSSGKSGTTSSNNSSNVSTMTASPSITSFHPYPSPPNSPQSQATSCLSPSRRPSKGSSSNSCLSPLPLPFAIPPSLDPIDPPTIGHSWEELQPGGVRGKAARILGEVTVPTGKAARLLGTEHGPKLKTGGGGSAVGKSMKAASKMTRNQGLKLHRYTSDDDDDDDLFNPRHHHGSGALLKTHRSSIELLTPEHSPPRSSSIRALHRASSENELGRVMAQARRRQKQNESPETGNETEDEDQAEDVFTRVHSPLGQWKNLPRPPSRSLVHLSTINESHSNTCHLNRRGSIDSLVDSTYHQSWPPLARSNGRVSVVPSLASIALPSIRSSSASTLTLGGTGKGEGSMWSWEGEEGMGFGEPMSSGSSWWEEGDSTSSPGTPRTPTTRFRYSTCGSSIYSTTSSFGVGVEKGSAITNGKGERTSSVHSDGSASRAKERAKSLLGPPRSMPPVGKLPPLPIPNIPLPPIPDGGTSMLTTEEWNMVGVRATTGSSISSAGRRSQRGHALEALEGRREVQRPQSGQGSRLSVLRKSMRRRMSTLPGDGEEDEEEEVAEDMEELLGFKRESRPFLDLEEEGRSEEEDREDGGRSLDYGADSDSDTISEFPNRGSGSRKSSVEATTTQPRASEFIKGQVLFNPDASKSTSNKLEDHSDWIEVRSDLLLEALDRTKIELRKVNPFPTFQEEDEERFNDLSPTTMMSRPSLRRSSASFHSDDQLSMEGFSPALDKLSEFFVESSKAEEEE
ncbi:BQ2448_7173 [Microbotryum intermedium]|uniref:BQ2448_7173 protein n=1 Tax=Microbotryum intermedium TaxID=269621 RepID=A0A238FPX1_9BASI|nr:BQ2448_7173 [Microbotryum intermedium]